MKKEATYIPAALGFSTIEAIRILDAEGGSPRYASRLIPVLAWQINQAQHKKTGEVEVVGVLPVTLTGPDKDNPVVYPDGRVELANVYRYDSIGEWLKGEIEDKRERENTSGSSSPPSASPPPVPDNLG